MLERCHGLKTARVRITGEPKSRSYFKKRISLATQHGNAMSLYKVKASPLPLGPLQPRFLRSGSNSNLNDITSYILEDVLDLPHNQISDSR